MAFEREILGVTNLGREVVRSYRSERRLSHSPQTCTSMRHFSE